jgi:hypothetical protein
MQSASRKANGGGRGANKPAHFARLRRPRGWQGGSRGKVRRMRAEPVVPVGLAGREGRDSRRKLAGMSVVGTRFDGPPRTFLALVESAEVVGVIGRMRSACERRDLRPVAKPSTTLTTPDKKAIKIDGCYLDGLRWRHINRKEVSLHEKGYRGKVIYARAT